MNLISSPNAGKSRQCRAARVSLSLTGVKVNRELDQSRILSYLRSPVVEIERNEVTGFSKRYRVWEGKERYQSRCRHVRADFPFERMERLFKWLVTDKESRSNHVAELMITRRFTVLSYAKFSAQIMIL